MHYHHFVSFNIFVITDHFSTGNWCTLTHTPGDTQKRWRNSPRHVFHTGVCGLLELYAVFCGVRWQVSNFLFFLSKLSLTGVKSNPVLHHLVATFHPSFDPGFYSLRVPLFLFSIAFALGEGEIKSRNNRKQRFFKVIRQWTHHMATEDISIWTKTGSQL